MKKITIHCVSSPQTAEYANRMFYIAQKLALHPQLLTMRTHESGRQGSSRGHAEGLIDVFKSIDDEGIHVIADSDTVLLRRGWDDDTRRMLAPRLLGEGWDFFGTAYDLKGSFSAGSGPVQAYKQCPTFTWLALDGDATRWQAFDPRPTEGTLPIRDALTAHIYGLDIGDELLRDVGWRLPEYMAMRKWATLERGRAVLAGLSEYNEEFHLDGKPFVAHQRGSSKHRFMSDPHSRPFYETCQLYLEGL